MTPMRGSRVADGRRLVGVAIPLAAACLLAAAGLGVAAPNATPAVTFEDLGVVGGTFQAVAADPARGRVLVGMEGRLGVVDARVPGAPLLLHRTHNLTDEISDIAVIGGRAWIAAGGAGLFSMDITTDTPDPGPPLAVPAGARRLATDPPFVLAATAAGAVLLNAEDPSFQAVMGAGPVTDVAMARFTAFLLQGDQILVFDITKPAQPREARVIRLDSEGTALAATRTLLFASDAESSLRVYGLDNPRNPRRRGALDSKHTVADILPVGAYAYLATEGSGIRPVHVLADPVEMSLGGRAQPSTAFAMSADGFNLYAAESDGLAVYDISQPSFPRRGGLIPTMADALDVSLRSGVLYAAGAGGLTFADVDPPTDSSVLARVSLGYPEVIAHLDQYVLVGDGSNMYVVDAADPVMARPVAVVPVRNYGRDIQNEYVSDIQVSGTSAFLANGRFGGLTVVDVTSPTLPSVMVAITTTGFATKLALAGPPGGDANLALVGDSQEGLIAYDIRDPRAPIKLSASGGSWFPYSVALWGEIAVVVAGEDGMFFYDVETDPGSPTFGQMRRLSSWWPGMSAWSVSIADGIAYVGGEGGSGCRVVAVDLVNPLEPREAGCWAAPGAVDALSVTGELLAVSAFGEGVRLARLTRAPSTPTATGMPTDPPAVVTPTPTGGTAAGAAYLPAVRTGGVGTDP